MILREDARLRQQAISEALLEHDSSDEEADDSRHSMDNISDMFIAVERGNHGDIEEQAEAEESDVLASGHVAQVRRDMSEVDNSPAQAAATAAEAKAEQARERRKKRRDEQQMIAQFKTNSACPSQQELRTVRDLCLCMGGRSVEKGVCGQEERLSETLILSCMY